MKQLLGFIRKEFRHIFRDPRTMIILFGIPIVQLLLFGYVITTEIKDARIAILDKSHDEVTREITHKLLSSGYFKLDAMLDNEGQIDNIFRQGNVKEVVVFQDDFGKRLKRDGQANCAGYCRCIGPEHCPVAFQLYERHCAGLPAEEIC